jgi:hypothetical protein
MTEVSLQQQLKDVKKLQIVTEMLKKENERLKKQLQKEREKQQLQKEKLKKKLQKEREKQQLQKEKFFNKMEKTHQNLRTQNLRIKKIEEEYDFYDLAKLPGQQKQSLLAKKQFLKQNYQAIENEQPIPNSRFTYSKKQKK